MILMTAIVAAMASTASAVSIPPCQSVAPLQPAIYPPSSNLTVPHAVIGLVYLNDNMALVAIEGGNIGVLNTSTFTPTLVHEIPLPTPWFKPSYGEGAWAITRDKQNAYLAVGLGAVIIDVQKAVRGDTDAIAGVLTGTQGTGAIQVSLSADEEYAFVSQEYGLNATAPRGAIEVFHVHRNSNGSVSNTHIGYTVLDFGVVGSALSPDGSKLFVTSEVNSSIPLAELNNTTGAGPGTLSVLDVETLKTNPSNALIGRIAAGCNPVRLQFSPCGTQVWLTARQSNSLLAFDAAKVTANSSDALLASVQVGNAPVGLLFINEGKHVLTADSNRFNLGNVTGLTVVDVEAALNGTQGFPRIPTGLFPREMALSPDGETVLVSQYSSHAIQSLDVRRLS